MLLFVKKLQESICLTYHFYDFVVSFNLNPERFAKSEVPVMTGKKQIVFIVFLLAVLSSCRKDESYIISGLVIDPNQVIPVADASVELWSQRIESGILMANYSLDESGITDENGRFSFTIPSRSYTALKLVFAKTGYYGWEAPVNVEKVKSGNGLDAEYQLLPKATIEFRVVNTEPFDDADYFEFRLLNGYTSCDECCKGEKYQFTGQSINQSVTCQVVGHQDIIIQWSKRKNGQQIIRNEPHFVKAFETTIINFNY